MDTLLDLFNSKTGIVLLPFVLLLLFGIIFKIILNLIKKLFKSDNQDSYLYYTKFVNGDSHPEIDEKFKEKLRSIEHCIKHGKTDINEIAKISNCSYEECILKIKYLENQGRLPNIHIDYKSNRVLKCIKEDIALLKKYLPYLRPRCFTLDELVIKKRTSLMQDFDSLKEEIFLDLKYLVDNDLISWIKLNEIDKEIIYFNENSKKDISVIVCPSCGAKNKVHNGHKVRCKYCKTILESKKENS